MLPLLEGVLAFSLTMLAVATAVSVVVDLLLKASRIRYDKLKDFLHLFYQQELRATVETELVRLGDKATTDAKAAISRAATKLASELSSVKGALPQPLLAAASSAGPGTNKPIDECKTMRLTKVGTKEMVERFRRSELGHELMSKLGDEAETVFKKLGERYEMFGEFFSEQFRGRMHFWSGVVAVILALAVNIDSFQILRTFMQDQEARALVIAQEGPILQQYQALSADQGGGRDLSAQMDEALKDVRALASGSFPIGWQYYPHCSEPSPDSRCRTDPSSSSYKGLFVTWIAGCLLTGAMAGLGSPFWYDAVSAMLLTVRVLRSGRRTEADAKQTPEARA